MRLPASAPYRRLLSATVISQFGDWSARIALAALIFEATHDEFWVGLLGAVFVIPWVGLGQLATSVTERFDRRTVMVVADLIRAFSYMVIVAVELNPTGVLALVFLVATVDPAFEANASAASYDSLDPDDADDGLRAKHVLNLTAQVLALALAGVALSIFDPRAIIVVNSLSFFVSATIIATTRLSDRAAGGDQVSVPFRDAVRSAGHGHIRAALLVTMITVFAAQAFETQIVVIADQDVRPTWVLPVAAAVVPAAVAIATALAPTDGPTRPVLRRALAITTIAAAVAIVMFEVDTAWGVVVAGFCAGVMFLATTSGQIVAFRHLPTEGRVATINVLQTMVFVAVASGAFASGVMVSLFGVQRGMQICIAVAVLAWLVPLPDDHP